MDPIFYYLNNSKFFAGCTMMLMNIGGKYMGHDLPKSLDNIFKNEWLRRLVIFSVAFVSTRDIKISILITLLFVLVFRILLNEKSKGCILSQEYIDFDESGNVTYEEVIKAKEILKKYKKSKTI